MNKLTPDILLDRWMHAAEARDYNLKTWKGVLSFWAKWMRLLLDSPWNEQHPTPRLPHHLRPLVESELRWCLADLQYLTTMTYHEPQDCLAPPSAASRNGAPHPFIHLILDRRSRRRGKVAVGPQTSDSTPAKGPAGTTSSPSRGARYAVQRPHQPTKETT